MTQATPTFVALLSHPEGTTPRAFQAESTEAATARAVAALLETTEDYRNSEDYETEDAWLEACWEDGWDITCAILE